MEEQASPVPKTHAVLSPSGADRWMTCLGSTALTKDLPNVENEYSTEGVDHHELAAVVLDEVIDGNEDASALEYVGRALKSGALVTEENAKHLQEGYIEPMKVHAARGTLLVEEEVPLAWYTGNPKDEGTSDAVVITEDRELFVGDLKFGRGVEVSPDDNRQCKIYAIGVIEKHGLQEEYDTVRIGIFQPRAGDGKPKEWVVSMADLLDFKREVQRKAGLIDGAESSKTELPLTPSEKACRFCKAKATCPALRKLVDNATTDGFEDLTKAKPGDTMSVPEILGSAMDKVDLVEIWMKGVRSQVEIELLAGHLVIGTDGPYKLVQGKKGNRKWQDENEAEELLKSFRLKKEVMYDFSLISPTTADKRLSKDYPRRWAKIKPLITQSEGSKHVANANDPRPAIEVEKPEDGFETVGEFDDLV